VGGLDPDNRSIEGDGLISECSSGGWQKPAGDEQQSRKRASNKHEIAGYRHRLPLLKIEHQLRLWDIPEKPNASLSSHLLARRRCYDDGSWPYLGKESHEAQRPDGERSQTE
jgi:hypothetical protein